MNVIQAGTGTPITGTDSNPLTATLGDDGTLTFSDGSTPVTILPFNPEDSTSVNTIAGIQLAISGSSNISVASLSPGYAIAGGDGKGAFWVFGATADATIPAGTANKAPAFTPPNVLTNSTPGPNVTVGGVEYTTTQYTVTVIGPAA